MDNWGTILRNSDDLLFNNLFKDKFYIWLSGVAKGDGRDLTCKIITTSKIWEYDFGAQSECKVCLKEFLTEIAKHGLWLL